MATLDIYNTWVWSGQYLQTLRRKVGRLVRHRTPPRNQGGEIEGGGEVSWITPCCSVRVPANRNCRLNLKTNLPDDSRRSWGGCISFRTLRTEGWTTTSRRPAWNDRGVGNHWFESVNGYHINLVPHLEAEKFALTFQYFVRTSV